jgi:hypothetical protein
MRERPLYFTKQQKKREREREQEVPRLSALSVDCEREMDAERRVTRSSMMSFRLGSGTGDVVVVFVILFVCFPDLQVVNRELEWGTMWRGCASLRGNKSSCWTDTWWRVWLIIGDHIKNLIAPCSKNQSPFPFPFKHHLSKIM